MDDTQFGGRKGAGTDHMLAELITEQLEHLDDNRAAVAFISVDLSKAFNRMAHGHCLRSMAEQGASNQTLNMTASFLENRKMRVKLSGGNYSTLRKMPGGAPQGTKCGNILFCIATASIHRPESGNWTDSDGSMDDQAIPNSLGLVDLAERLREDLLSSPLGGYHLDTRMHNKSAVLDYNDLGEDQQPRPPHSPPPRWTEEPISVKKFIDDVTAIEKCDLTSARSTFTTQKERRDVHAVGCQEFLDTVIENAAKIGMVVNPQKTQLLCSTTAINYDVRAYVYVNGEELSSKDNLKTVGFTLGRRPGAAEQVKAMRRKYGARCGILRHLKKMDFDTGTLVQIYCSLIRPVMEYSSNAFHTILTREQSEDIERLQRKALKTIFGQEKPYAASLSESGLERLDERRDRLFRSFTEKCYTSNRFSTRWFQERPKSGYPLRRQEKVVQKFAHCDRLQCAPLYLSLIHI